MSNSPEYNAFLDCISELRLAVKASPLSLSSDLVAARLISPEKEESLRNRSKDDVDRAADLTSLLLDKIQQDPKKYYGMFVEVLKKDEDQYETVLQLLEQKYRLRTKEGGPSLSEDRGNGTSIINNYYCLMGETMFSVGQIVKLKVVAAESGGVQPHKPMLADSSSQTPCLVSSKLCSEEKVSESCPDFTE